MDSSRGDSPPLAREIVAVINDECHPLNEAPATAKLKLVKKRGFEDCESRSLVDLENYPTRHNSEKLFLAKSPSVRFSRVAESRHMHSRSIQHVNDICKQRFKPVSVVHSGSSSVSQSPNLSNVLITTTATALETNSESQPVQVIFHSQKKKLPRIIPDTTLQQSEDDLILDFARKQEFSEMNSVQLKEEETILKNIKKREMLDKTHLDSKALAREKEEKNKIKENIETSRTKKVVMAAPMPPTTALIACAPPSPMAGPNQSEPPLTRRLTFSKDSPRGSLKVAAAASQDTKDKFKRWHTDLLQLIVDSYNTLNFSRHRPEVQPRYDRSDFVKECLDEHNALRERHQAPPLELDLNLCAKAQDWANVLAHEDRVYYKNSVNYGESIFLMPCQVVQGRRLSCSVSGKDVATVWYKTGADYDFEKDPRVLHAQRGQFSQMIWKSSTHFGCGRAKSKRDKMIVVGFYYPRGNAPHQFAENVLQPSE